MDNKLLYFGTERDVHFIKSGRFRMGLQHGKDARQITNQPVAPFANMV